MTTSSTLALPASSGTGRSLAIAAAAAFTAGGLTLLLGEAITTPSQWTTAHGLTVLTVFGTVAAGHLAAEAARALRHALAALGFALLFLAGTGLVVYQSVGRQAETSETKESSAEDRNGRIAAKRSELIQARQRFDDANAEADLQRARGGCGKVCKDWELRATEVDAHVRELERELNALGAPVPVAPKAERMAKVAALFGADETKAKAALMLIEPFLLTLFFEIGSVVSLGFAFRSSYGSASPSAKPSPAAAPSESDRAQTSFADGGSFASLATFAAPENDDPNGSGPGRSGKRARAANVLAFPVAGKHPVVAALESVGGRAVTNGELARLMGVTDGEASKRRREVEAMLDERRDGKECRIRLRCGSASLPANPSPAAALVQRVSA